MSKIRDLLAGKKTYIFAACGVVVAGLYQFGYIDPSLADKLLWILGFGGLASLKAGLNR